MGPRCWPLANATRSHLEIDWQSMFSGSDRYVDSVHLAGCLCNAHRLQAGRTFAESAKSNRVHLVNIMLPITLDLKLRNTFSLRGNVAVCYCCFIGNLVRNRADSTI